MQGGQTERACGPSADMRYAKERDTVLIKHKKCDVTSPGKGKGNSKRDRMLYRMWEVAES